ncbi:hypothetical protein ACM01_22975 [Streptomyces viridochromogenes]|uniref:Uncharacterized protein n=1 Tax=Streptomyces viridochromogenes TaxID=1938 RepID=A0A0J7ZAB3_STRVR|nr:hypothetical protein [Streptomyces viridochromogenes]KMS72417.1 hypothetical protein ACM01_22975 [Streptomyces viridochromogenes]
MNSKADLASFARKLRAARLRRRGTADGTKPIAPWLKIRRRVRFLRWALMVQLLKGAAFAGGGILAQVLLARLFGA